MINYIYPICTFIFLFTVMALLRLGFNFSKAIFSNPPEKFELSLVETIITGLFVSYIITYLIY